MCKALATSYFCRSQSACKNCKILAIIIIYHKVHKNSHYDNYIQSLQYQSFEHQCQSGKDQWCENTNNGVKGRGPSGGSSIIPSIGISSGPSSSPSSSPPSVPSSSLCTSLRIIDTTSGGKRNKGRCRIVSTAAQLHAGILILYNSLQCYSLWCLSITYWLQGISAIIWTLIARCWSHLTCVKNLITRSRIKGTTEFSIWVPCTSCKIRKKINTACG